MIDHVVCFLCINWFHCIMECVFKHNYTLLHYYIRINLFDFFILFQFDFFFCADGLFFTDRCAYEVCF